MSLNETVPWKRIGSGTTSKHVAKAWSETDNEMKGTTYDEAFDETCYKQNKIDPGPTMSTVTHGS
jgi:hypothetical protein